MVSRVISYGLLICGALLIVGGILSLTLMPQIVNQQVLKRTFLGTIDHNGTLNEMTAKWKDPEYDILLQIWMFNVTNAVEVVRDGHRPHVAKCGPYSFREVIHKNNLTFIDNETELYYRNYRTYTYAPDRSCTNCSMHNDMVTFPNVVLQKAIAYINGKGRAYEKALDIILSLEKRETLFLSRSVGEALFAGYRDPLISDVCMQNKTGTLAELVKKICTDVFNVPAAIGFFYGRNGTDDGLYRIKSGQSDPNEIGRIITWNNYTILPESYWSSNESRAIYGTDGQLFKPLLTQFDKLPIFVSDLCRSVELDFKRSTEFEGIPALRFGIPDSALDSSRPENKGYCNPTEPRYYSNRTQPDACLPSGLLDISRCQPGAPPIILSLAHFLYAPKEVQQSIDGLDAPSEANDATYLDIEPTTGATIDAIRRMQLNIGMIKGNNLRITANMSNMIVPVLMLNESAVLDSATRDELLSKLVSLQRGFRTAGITILCIGTILWIAFALIHVIIHRRAMQHRAEEERAPLTDTDDLDNSTHSIRDRP